MIKEEKDILYKYQAWKPFLDQKDAMLNDQSETSNYDCSGCDGCDSCMTA